MLLSGPEGNLALAAERLWCLPNVAFFAALTRQENAAMKARMKEKAKAGGDAKALDADLQAARKEAADRRKMGRRWRRTS